MFANIRRTTLRNKQLLKQFSTNVIRREENDLTKTLYAPSSTTLNDYLSAESKAASNLKTTKLENELKVISTDSSSNGNAVVSLFVNAGSRFQNYNNNGIAHFVQRFFYSGTNQRTYLRLVTDLQKTGANVSVQAGREDIVYQFEALRGAVPQVLELVADSVLQGRLNDWDLKPKVDAVTHDLENYANVPEVILNEALHQTAFQSVTLGRNLICPPHNLHKIDNDQVLAYMNALYLPNRMTLVGTNVSHDDLTSMANALFGSAKNGGGDANVDTSASQYVGGVQRLHDRAIKGAHSILAWKGASHKNAHALSILRAALGQGSNRYTGSLQQPGSKLSKIVKSTNVESAKAFNHTYSDNGLLGVYVVGKGAEVTKALSEVVNTLKQVSSNGLSDSELKAAKSAATYDLASSLETSVGRNEFHATHGSVSEHLSALSGVTAQQVQKAAKDLLASNPTFVSFGDLEGLTPSVKV